MAPQPSQTKAAVKVNSVRVKASSMLAAPRRRCVTEAVASNSMGIRSTRLLEGLGATLITSNVRAPKKTARGMMVSRCQKVSLRRQKVQAAIGQAGQVAHAKSLTKLSVALGSSDRLRRGVTGQMASKSASAKL